MKARIDFRSWGWLVLGAGVASTVGCGDGGDGDLDAAAAAQAGMSASAGKGGAAGGGGTATAGASATGGTGATGGTATAGAGGSGMSGGPGSGGGAGNGQTGGTTSAGGTSSAGMSAGGSAGMATGGGGGSGGAVPTSGCMASDWPMAGTQMLTVVGTEREFIVAVPEDYDPTQPYRLAFAFHGRTGTAQQIAGGFGGGYYGMLSRIGDSTILVSPQGLGTDDDPDDTGWPNTDGRDIDFVRAMIDWLGQSYCIDQSRIFSTGFSYGGMMSNTIGCEMPDVFRAIAPMAGALFGRGGSCEEPPGIATWMVHGTADETVTFEQGEAARDVFLAKNGCDATTEPVPVEPEGCVEYQGCEPGTPLIWCTHAGAHTIPSFTQDGISEFFEGF